MSEVAAVELLRAREGPRTRVNFSRSKEHRTPRSSVPENESREVPVH